MAAAPVANPVVPKVEWRVPTSSVAPRYMRNFKCLAADCEDTCCGGWSVEISKSRHRRLKVLHSGSAKDRSEFKQKIAVTRTLERSKAAFAYAKIDEAGRCAFLGDDALCDIQRRFGEAELPELCAVFPRHYFQIEERLECVSTLSCPEMARLCLLDEQAMNIEELLPATSVALARPWVSLAAVRNPAQYCFEDVRVTILEILSRTQYPLRVRLSFLLCLAEQLRPVLAQQPPEGSAPVSAQVERILQMALQDDVLQLEAAGLAGIEGSGAAVAVLLRFVLDVLAGYRGPRLGSLARAIRANYRVLLGIEAEADAAGTAGTHEIAQELEEVSVLNQYRACAQQLEQRFAARIDQYFTHYCLNYVLREPYFERASLFEYLRDLVLQVAVLRFCLLSHPRIFGAARGALDEAQLSELRATRLTLSEAELDARAVETVQQFARDVEHSQHGLRELIRVLQELGLDGVGHVLRVAQL